MTEFESLGDILAVGSTVSRRPPPGVPGPVDPAGGRAADGDQADLDPPDMSTLPEGLEPAAPPVALDPVAVAPAATLDEGIVVLRVSIADDPDGDRFRLAGDCPGLPLPDTAGDSQRRPTVGLADLTGELAPWQIGPQLRSWSESKAELTEWLHAVRARHGDKLRLIIDDQTGWEIPWELLWLPAAGAPGDAAGWLGAAVPVARRSLARRAGAAQEPAGRHACGGEVLAYVDATMSDDSEILGPYGVVPLTDLDEVLDRLEAEDDGLGLLYFAAHGEYSEHGNKFVLGGLSVFELEQSDIVALRRSRAFVFLNACHSARTACDVRNNDGTPRGFARAFLDHGAPGVIGTSAPVGTAEARTIAGDLLGRLAAGVPAATALRDMRREVAARHAALGRRQLREPDGVRRTQALIDAFSYLYFGHPDTTVRLSPPEVGS